MTLQEIQILKDLTLFWVIPWFAGIYILACVVENILRWWKK